MRLRIGRIKVRNSSRRYVLIFLKMKKQKNQKLVSDKFVGSSCVSYRKLQKKKKPCYQACIKSDVQCIKLYTLLCIKLYTLLKQLDKIFPKTKSLCPYKKE